MFLAKLKGEGPLNHLLHVGVMLTIISVHHPIPTHANREHPENFENKSVSSAFN